MVAAKNISTNIEAPPTPAKYALVDVDKVTPDPGQPRKSFDQQKLGELAESVKVHGVIVPLEVRKHPSKPEDWFMIVAGERRWRAAKLAGLAQVPVLIVDLPAELVLEHQLIENSQREDVPPLEEAEAYDALLKKHGYTMERLVQKTGRSKAHLYGRLKLIGLCPGAKKAMQSGELAPAIAELIARIADPKLQEQATKDVLGQGSNYGWDLRPEEVEYADDKRRASPLSFRAAVQLLRRRYQTQFDLRKFDPVDKSLLPKVGACTDCPHRAGNQPALPGLAPPKGVDDDYCTKPSCFEEKVEAAFDLKAQHAKAMGLKVIDGAAAKKILPFNDGETASDAPYVDPKQQLPYNLAKPGSNATYASLLGKKAAEVPKVIVKDPSTGAARELLDKEKAHELLLEMGKIDKPAKKKSASSTSSNDDWKKQNERDEKKRQLNEAAVTRVLEKVAEKAAEEPSDQKSLAWTRWIARAVIRDYAEAGGDDSELVLQRRGCENYDQLEQHVTKAKSLGEVRGLLVEFLVCLHASAKIRSWVDKRRHEMFEEALKLFGVDWDKALAAAKDAAKTEAKAEAAKAKSPTAKKGKSK